MAKRKHAGVEQEPAGFFDPPEGEEVDTAKKENKKAEKEDEGGRGI